MKICTWNVNSLTVRLPQVLDFLAQHQPDVLVLQELKLEHDKFPRAVFEMSGWQVVWNGQKTYNGVAIISKHALHDVVCDLPQLPDDVQKRVITATINGTRIINVYCVNGESLDSEKFAYKRQWFGALREHVRTQLAQYPDLVLLGDFNIAPSDRDVYDAEKLRGRILCSPEERQWFDDLLALGLHDGLKLCYPEESVYTWWDYRARMFQRGLGMRIDHILIGDSLKARVRNAGVDLATRALERPSDHAPVWLEWA